MQHVFSFHDLDDEVWSYVDTWYILSFWHQHLRDKKAGSHWIPLACLSESEQKHMQNMTRYKPFTMSWSSRLLQPKSLRFRDRRLHVAEVGWKGSYIESIELVILFKNVWKWKDLKSFGLETTSFKNFLHSLRRGFFTTELLWRPVSRKSFIGRTWTTVGCTGASAVERVERLTCRNPCWKIPVSLPATVKASQVPQVLHPHGGAARFSIFSLLVVRFSNTPPKLQLRSISKFEKCKGTFRKKLGPICRGHLFVT